MKARQPGDKVTGDPPGIAAMQLRKELSTESSPEHPRVFHHLELVVSASLGTSDTSTGSKTKTCPFPLLHVFADHGHSLLLLRMFVCLLAVVLCLLAARARHARRSDPLWSKRTAREAGRTFQRRLPSWLLLWCPSQQK